MAGPSGWGRAAALHWARCSCDTSAALQYVQAVIEATCGGAMLTMISNTVLPEAFE